MVYRPFVRVISDGIKATNKDEFLVYLIEIDDNSSIIQKGAPSAPSSGNSTNYHDQMARF